MLSVLLQLKALISEKMKYEYKHEHGDLLFYLLVELSFKFPVVYINI